LYTDSFVKYKEEYHDMEDKNELKIKDIRKKREENDALQDSLKIVVDLAVIKCPLCTVPAGFLKVNFDTPTIQGKKTATVKETGNESFVFTGLCTKSPDGRAPCSSVMVLGTWENPGTIRSQDEFVLLQKSKIKCIYGNTYITVTDSGQVYEPEDIDTEGMPVP
jgi:hypothetical protein